MVEILLEPVIFFAMVLLSVLVLLNFKAQFIEWMRWNGTIYQINDPSIDRPLRLRLLYYPNHSHLILKQLYFSVRTKPLGGKSVHLPHLQLVVLRESVTILSLTFGLIMDQSMMVQCLNLLHFLKINLITIH